MDKEDKPKTSGSDKKEEISHPSQEPNKDEEKPKQETLPQIKSTRQLFPSDKQGYVKLFVIPIASAIVAKLLSNDMVDRLLTRFIKNSIVLETVKILILVVFIALLLIVFKCL